MKQRIIAILLFLIGVSAAYFVYTSEPKLASSDLIPVLKTETSTSSDFRPFKLGLDLAGGTRLVYKADLSNLTGSPNEAMSALRDVIERRVNLFGVGEPVVQTEKSTLQGEDRLVVELPGVTDIDSAINMIGQTPTLEFKTQRDEESKAKILKAREDFVQAQQSGKQVTLTQDILEDPDFISTGLTGRYLKKAQVVFNQQNQPEVSLQFDDQGSKLFEDITKENIGKPVAIYLDGSPISIPVVNQAISGGQALIQGDFSLDEAKTLTGRLNSGALPVPISLIGTEQIGPTLGQMAIEDGVRAAIIGLLIVSLFFIVWYRLPGLMAVIALSMYIAIVLTIFKLLPVTITAAGIAGFIISIGLAVDANVLIFERMKEELKKGSELYDAIMTGFSRAWTSIRDSNISSLITATILFMFGSSIVKGFALVFGIGVIVSMFSAVFVTRYFLISFANSKKLSKNNKLKFLFGSGLTK